MKKAFQIILLIIIISSCKDSKNENKQTISYNTGIENCLTIKESSSSVSPFLTNDCMVGSEIPPFKTTSIEGIEISKELLKGKLSIINFWFTTCPPCVAEIPGFNAIVEKFGKDEMNYISIARNQKDEVKDFLGKQPWDFIHISNENDIINSVFKMPFGYPTTFLLNKDAQIIKSFSGGAMGEEAILEIQNKLIPAIEKEMKSK